MQFVPDHKSRPINNVDHKTEATVVSTVLTKQDKVMDVLRSLTIRLDILHTHTNVSRKGTMLEAVQLIMDSLSRETSNPQRYGSSILG